MGAVPTVALYGRPGCHLCDDARAQLLAAGAPSWASRSSSTTSRPTTSCMRRYLERIPVVALDGEELFDFFVDEAVLRGRLGTVGGG